MTREELKDAITTRAIEGITGILLGAVGEGKEETIYSDLTLQVEPGRLLDVVSTLKDDEALAFDLHVLNSGVDYGDRIEVVYHFDSTVHKHELALKVVLDRETPKIDSLCSLYPAANWLERETFDLVGVVFEGHPELKRILCAEDWEGHPLRRDYVIPESYHGVPNTFEQFYVDNTPDEGLSTGGGVNTPKPAKGKK